MNKKKLIIAVSAAVLLVLVIIIILALGSQDNEELILPDSPNNLAALAQKAIAADDYQAFQELFASNAQNKVTKDDFSALTEVMTEGFLTSNYSLVRLENGKMLLIYMSGSDDAGRYQIKDVKIVPEDQYDMFNH